MRRVRFGLSSFCGGPLKTGDYKPIHPDSPIRVQIGGGPDSANHNAYYGRMGFAVDDVDKAQEITKKVRSADTDPLGLYILGAPEMSRSQRQFLDIYLQEMAEHAQRYGKQVEANKAVQEATRYLRRVAAEARKMGAKVPDPFRGISMLPSTPQELREALEKGCLDSFLCDGIWASFWVARSRKN